MAGAANHNSATVGDDVGIPSGANGKLAASPTEEIIRHLYVHIPFCARICPYCAFYKELLDRSQTQRFCEALLAELHQRARDLFPTTIYFGGGTPTALTTRQLEFLVSGFRDQLDLSELIEWTTEANPGSVSAGKAGLLQRLGINRISLGVQSWDDDLLKLLGREHSAKQAEESFAIFRDAGFSNINVDLMFGLPGQTILQWQATLERTLALGCEHISTYCLTYEEDTEFFLRHAHGEFQQNPDSDAEFFDVTMSILESAGYEQYEISNYARPGFRSAHNRVYWSGADFLGIGPSAFSTVGMKRWQNILDFRRYADQVLAGESAICSVEDLTPEMKRAEKIALALRTDHGAPAKLLHSFPAKRDEFVRLGLLEESRGNFALTRKGKLLADSVAEAFI
ncbi:MAG TPA: radical SAM family heme chaperone HemW [Chthoniobacterales bacterium]|nr:radical SAM family heme chaperone HemW [Chthoniobacterales bacterium]